LSECDVGDTGEGEGKGKPYQCLFSFHSNL
jgi:hypothetical protein